REYSTRTLEHLWPEGLRRMGEVGQTDSWLSFVADNRGEGGPGTPSNKSGDGSVSGSDMLNASLNLGESLTLMSPSAELAEEFNGGTENSPSPIDGPEQEDEPHHSYRATAGETSPRKSSVSSHSPTGGAGIRVRMRKPGALSKTAAASPASIPISTPSTPPLKTPPRVNRTASVSISFEDHVQRSPARGQPQDLAPSRRSKMVRVAVRVRPLIPVEEGSRRVVCGVGEGGMVVVNPTKFKASPDAISAAAAVVSRAHMASSDWARLFEFDKTFWSTEGDGCSEPALQADVHRGLRDWIVGGVMQGVHHSCFTYGHTGSGKTYSMFGRRPGAMPDEGNIGEDMGLAPRVCLDLLQHSSREVHLAVTFVEVYLDKIKDLLNPAADSSKFKVREHPQLGPYVHNLPPVKVTTWKEMAQLLEQGSAARAMADTSENLCSSRGHAILTLDVTEAGGKVLSRVQMVDLAGSEKEPMGEPTGEGQGRRYGSTQLREMAMIKKALSNLGTIIKSLAKGEKTAGLPYRDSTLTWLLKEALGGRACTTMLATVSPSSDSYLETMNTLKYAERLTRVRVAGGGMRGSKLAENPERLQAEMQAVLLQLGAEGSEAVRQVLYQTVADPQQRIAKLTGGVDRRGSAGSALTGERRGSTGSVLGMGKEATMHAGTNGTAINRAKSARDFGRSGSLRDFGFEVPSFGGAAEEVAEGGSESEEERAAAAEEVVQRMIADTSAEAEDLALAKPASVASVASVASLGASVGDGRGSLSRRASLSEAQQAELMRLEAYVAELEASLKIVRMERDLAVAENARAEAVGWKSGHAEGKVAAEAAEEARRAMAAANEGLKSRLKELLKECEWHKQEAVDARLAVEEAGKAARAEAQQRASSHEKELSVRQAELERLEGLLLAAEEEKGELGRALAAADAALLNQEGAVIAAEAAGSEGAAQEIADLKAVVRASEVERSKLRTELVEEAGEVRTLKAALAEAQEQLEGGRMSEERAVEELSKELVQARGERDQAMSAAWGQKAIAEEQVRKLQQRQEALEKLAQETAVSSSNDALEALLADEGELLQGEIGQMQSLVKRLREAKLVVESTRQSLEAERQAHVCTKAELKEAKEQQVAEAAASSAAVEAARRGVAVAEISRLQEELSVEQVLRQEQQEEFAQRLQEQEERSAAELEKSLVDVLEGVKAQTAAIREQVGRLQGEKEAALESARQAQAAATAAEADKARLHNELDESRKSSSRELAALWLAINKLDVLDAAKDAALQEMQSTRDKAITHMVEEVSDLKNNNQSLSQELAEIDASLVEALESEGVSLSSL
ncbi:unnamed protein product, partial [Chrysoparadoxa australica]